MQCCQHGQQTEFLCLRSGEVWALDVDAEEQRLATGSADADLRLYSIQSPEGAAAASSVFASTLCLHSCQRLMCCADHPTSDHHSPPITSPMRPVVTTAAAIRCSLSPATNEQH